MNRLASIKELRENMSWAAFLLVLYSVQIINGYYHDFWSPQGKMMPQDTYITESDALQRLQHTKRSYYRRYRGRKSCQQWNSFCYPWAKRKEHTCCFNQGLTCQCNLWMQNCRCVSKLWGR